MNQTLLKLAMPRLMLRTIVIAIVSGIWFGASLWLLNTGKSVSYASFNAMGQATLDVLTRINPYLWWGAVAIWSLIVFFSTRAWLNRDLIAGRATPIPPATLSPLVAGLSDEVISVIRWTWSDREDPLTIGDLQRARSEVRHSRIDKIAMVQEQTEILEARTLHATGRASDSRDSRDLRDRDARLREPAERGSTRRDEPRIGPAR